MEPRVFLCKEEEYEHCLKYLIINCKCDVCHI